MPRSVRPIFEALENRQLLTSAPVPLPVTSNIKGALIANTKVESVNLLPPGITPASTFTVTAPKNCRSRCTDSSHNYPWCHGSRATRSLCPCSRLDFEIGHSPHRTICMELWRCLADRNRVRI